MGSTHPTGMHSCFTCVCLFTGGGGFCDRTPRKGSPDKDPWKGTPVSGPKCDGYLINHHNRLFSQSASVLQFTRSQLSQLIVRPQQEERSNQA